MGTTCYILQGHIHLPTMDMTEEELAGRIKLHLEQLAGADVRELQVIDPEARIRAVIDRLEGTDLIEVEGPTFESFLASLMDREEIIQ